MAESKSKKSADKFFDVAKPGKTAPSSTSRPVIITNRPVLKDPMVIRVDTGDDDTAKDANAAPDASTEMKHKVDVRPLHIDLESVLAPSAPEVKKPAKKAAGPKDKDEKPADEPSPEAPKKAIAIQDESDEPAELPASETPAEKATESVPEVEPTEPEAPAEEAAVPEPAQEQEKEQKPASEPAKDEKPAERLPTREKVIAPPAESTLSEPAEKPAEEVPAEAEQPAETDAPAEDAPAEFGTDEDEPSLDNSDKPVLSEKEAKAAEAAKQKAAEQEKIIASGEFYLPINAVEKRRMKRNILIGIVLLVILLVAAALAAWDAGMFSIPGYQPPTNFL